MGEREVDNFVVIESVFVVTILFVNLIISFNVACHYG